MSDLYPEASADGDRHALAEDPDAAPAPEPVERTGHPGVDAVLDSLDELDDLPTDEHVTVFERAHDQLRRVLDEARDRDR